MAKMARPGKTKAPSTKRPIRQRAKRMVAADRKAMILDEAGRFFAKHGFSGSTRDLAEGIGIRQALLYKYFSSKDALVSDVLGSNFNKEWLARTTSASDRPQDERLANFFAGHAGDPLRLRLFLRAALDGVHFSDKTIRAAGLDALL